MLNGHQGALRCANFRQPAAGGTSNAGVCWKQQVCCSPSAGSKASWMNRELSSRLWLPQQMAWQSWPVFCGVQECVSELSMLRVGALMGHGGESRNSLAALDWVWAVLVWIYEFGVQIQIFLISVCSEDIEAMASQWQWTKPGPRPSFWVHTTEPQESCRKCSFSVGPGKGIPGSTLLCQQVNKCSKNTCGDSPKGHRSLHRGRPTDQVWEWPSE